MKVKDEQPFICMNWCMNRRMLSFREGGKNFSQTHGGHVQFVIKN